MVPWFWAVHTGHALFIGVASSSWAHPSGGFGAFVSAAIDRRSEGLFDAPAPALLRLKKCHGGLGQVGASSEGRRKRGRCSFFFLLLLTGDDSHGISMKPISKSFPMDKGLKNQDSGKNQRFLQIKKNEVSGDGFENVERL